MKNRRIVALALGVTAVLAACGGDDEGSDGDGGDQGGGQAEQEPEEEAEPAAAPELVLPDSVTYAEPVTFEVENGTITSADVVGEQGALEGTADGAGWTSESPPLPGASYDVAVEATDADGGTHSLSGAFTVDEVPDGERLTLSVVRGGGEVVGVGTPIIVKFDQQVEERAAVEAAMNVASDPQVNGAWYWVNPQEAHFRPEKYWPANSRIRVNLDLNGVQAGPNLWGGRAYEYDIEVGDERIARVDAAAKQFSLIHNGETVATWPTSLGAPDFATRNGTYVVQSKKNKYRMTSCNAGIACDESDPEYYDVDTKFAVRRRRRGRPIDSRGGRSRPTWRPWNGRLEPLVGRAFDPVRDGRVHHRPALGDALLLTGRARTADSSFAPGNTYTRAVPGSSGARRLSSVGRAVHS